jgi:putative sigma-54 modulation protein
MALEVEIFGRNMEITERVKEYVQKKVIKLDRYLNGVDEARVDLAFVKSARSAADRQVAQITIRGKGILLRSEERSDDIYSALDAALEKLQRQMERYKGKHHHGRGDGRSASEAAGAPGSEVEEVEAGEQAPVIVRRKHFIITPMDEEEALEQMVLLGHEDFFVFFNVNTNTVNILYRRRDGTFGLIEPEIA